MIELLPLLLILASTSKSFKIISNAIFYEVSILKVSNKIIMTFSQTDIFVTNVGLNNKIGKFISQFEIINHPDVYKCWEINDDILDKIKYEKDIYLIPLLSSQNDLIKLLNNLKIEFADC